MSILQSTDAAVEQLSRASLMAHRVKNLPAMQETQETQVQSLGREDPLEEGMATHSSILACKIPWTKETGTHTQTKKSHSKSHNRLNMPLSN